MSLLAQRFYMVNPWMYKENRIQCWRQGHVHSYEGCAGFQFSLAANLNGDKTIQSFVSSRLLKYHQTEWIKF